MHKLSCAHGPWGLVSAYPGQGGCPAGGGPPSGLSPRLQAHVLSNAKIDVPPESLSAPQCLQAEGETTEVVPAPTVTPVDLDIDPPSSEDLPSEATRLGHALQAHDIGTPRIDPPVLTQLSGQLPDQGWVARLALRAHQVVNATAAREAPAWLGC